MEHRNRPLVSSALGDGKSTGSQRRVGRASPLGVVVAASAPIAPIARHKRQGNRFTVRPSIAAERGDPTAAATSARNCGPTKRAQTGRANVTGSGEGG